MDPKLITKSGSTAIDNSVLEAIQTLNVKITPPKETLEFILSFDLY
ncbi:MAG: hypothetical protein ACD_79C00256G0001 [uncultured bacterium]|nr:MAG: hypothetical protein ACD_79C00256G0001 [uncultured bacterium]